MSAPDLSAPHYLEGMYVMALINESSTATSIFNLIYVLLSAFQLKTWYAKEKMLKFVLIIF